ncbi:MAG: hypothetical protein ACRELY_17890 [Polyangiaceae bacterium]
MNRTQRSKAEHVGTADFRANLAKYLRRVKLGRVLVVQERGKDSFMISKIEPLADSGRGCMKDRTTYEPGAILNAEEDWTPPDFP